MKTILIALIIMLPVLLTGQQGGAEDLEVPGNQPDFWMDVQPADSLKYDAGGVVGAITIDGVTYSQVRLRQELALGRFGIGIDLDILVDSDGKIRKDDWDEWQDYLGKIFYIRYGWRRDFLYFKTGSISDYTLGKGLIFNNYSNMLRYPAEKNIGSYVGMNLKQLSGLGFELYTHDIFKNQILAGRAHVKPLQFFSKSLFGDFTVGVNAGLDRDQLGRYPDFDGDGVPDVYDKFPKDKRYAADTDDDGIPDDIDFDIDGDGIMDGPRNPYVSQIFPNIYENYPLYAFDNDFVADHLEVYKSKKPVFIYGLDYELPFLETDKLKVSNYGEIAAIKDHGYGFVFPGFGAQYSNFEAKLEFRNFGKEFLPSYFDGIYERKRSEMQFEYRPVADTVNTMGRFYYLNTKDQILSRINPMMGWFGCLQAKLWEMLTFRAAFQDMYGKDMVAGKSLWTKLEVEPKFIPKLKKANFYYSQTNANYIDFRHPRNKHAHVAGELIYMISSNANFIARYSETYSDLNNDGRIRGRNEINEILTFGVEFVF